MVFREREDLMPFVRRFRRLHAVLRTVVGAMFCLATPTTLTAQTTSASVSGSVKDSQSGILPGATVALTSRTQGNTLSAVTDDQGRFIFPIVRPDTYSLKVSMQGFKGLQQTNLVVNANDKIALGVLTLEVGGIEENVSVLARVTELQAESGERSFTMENETLKNIANNGRSIFTFATLVPGVGTALANDAAASQTSDLVVNGQRPPTPRTWRRPGAGNAIAA
jgi:hypothetical protein